MNLKLRDSIYILKESEDTYQVIFTSTRKIKKFRVDSLVKRAIDELKTEQSEEDFMKALSGKHPRKDIDNCLHALESFGIIKKYDENINGKQEKQILFLDELTESWQETMNLQKKIENSKIAVFGVGGIGTWIINGLHQIGIGEIRIVDNDKVEESNLNRQLFFDSRDVGRYKVDIVKEKLADANVVSFKKRISEKENLEEIIYGTHFLVNCADEPSVAETSRIIDKYAQKHKIPYLVSGGYNMHLGMIGPIIIPGQTATFNDFLEYQKKNDSLSNLEKIKDISQTGNIGPIAGAVANIQVMEIFKYLIGKGKLNLNRFAEIDFMDFGVEWREFGKKE